MTIKKTRKNKSVKTINSTESKVHTIPELRRAFEEIDRFVKSKHPTTQEFQAKWKQIFGKQVSTESAQDYLSFVRESVKTAIQKGGAAPLSYDMRAGADIPFGNFPPYVSSGFGVSVPRDSFPESYQAGAPNPSPAQATLLKGGARKTRKIRKQKGGGMITEMMTRLFPASSPPSLGQETQMSLKGAPISIPGDPTVNAFKFVPVGGASQSISALDVSRSV
jgi:hypothetical protein